MRWEDERWVKVYTRDTGEWLALGWEAQALFMFALRKADRAGILKTGKMRARGLAGMTGMPLDVVERSVPLLLDDGCMREMEGGYIIPNFIAAQEAHTSASQRKRDQRERDRDRALADGMPEATSDMGVNHLSKMSRQEVTHDGHSMSSRQEVTPGGHAGKVTPRVDKSRVEEREDLPPPSSAAARDDFRLEPEKPRRKASKQEKATDPRHAPLTAELCEQDGWPHHGGRTAKAVTELLRLAGEEGPLEVLRRAAIARGHDSFPRVRELHELVTHWGHFAEPARRGQAPPDGLEPAAPHTCAGCGMRGQGGSVGEPEVWLGYDCGCLPAFTEAQGQGLHFTKAAEWAAQRRAA